MSKSKKAPIAAHPAFPAVVALWFATLLGLGSLVVPIVVFEQLVSATGLSSIVASLAPPLGMTARLGIAAIAALLGGGLGLFLARKVSAGGRCKNAPVVVRKREDRLDREPAKRPISAHEELGPDSLDSPLGKKVQAEEVVAEEPLEAEFEHVEEAPEPVAEEPASEPAFAGKTIPGRRRAFSVNDESSKSEYLEFVPLPGGDEALDEPHLAVRNDDLMPLDLDEFVDEDEADHEDLSALANLRRSLSNETLATSLARSDEADVAEEDEVPSDDVAAPAPRPFDAPAVEAEREEAPAPAAFAIPEIAEPAAEEPLEPVVPEDSEPGDVASRPLGELGMVELVERFARALQNTPRPEETEAVEEAELVEDVEPAAAEAVTFEPAPVVEQPVVVDDMPVEEPVEATAQEEPAQGEIAVAEEEVAAAAPMVFRRQVSAPVAQPEEESVETVEDAAPPSFEAAPQVPKMLQSFAGIEDDEEDEDDDHFPSFKLPSAAPAPSPAQPRVRLDTAPPRAFDEEDDSSEDAYPSLLSMRGRIGESQGFVRIEDDGVAPADEEPVVVFPGQENTARPASDGPTRDPAMGQKFAPPQQDAPAPRRFDAPAEPQQFGAPKAAATPADRSETEQALRDALIKLQRMSGAA
ncbi:hypothetical protein [Erythrobacter sp. HKB08]|uniref:hypothetical protein n=1 Tax=Erythrobacter sp. HKB08 TaxID=2502843 RepID=UPI001008B65F|nr:hypothetical protein [Erythrobacter sp. HKB08]